MLSSPTHQALLAKVLHDLSAPLSALQMGVEGIESQIPAEMHAILQSSLHTANNRLRLFRQLFARSAAPDSEVAIASMLQFIQSLCPQRLNIDWPKGLLPAASMTRLLMVLILFVVEAMPRGGTITLAIVGDALQITCTGAIVVANALNQLLTIDAELTSRNAVAAAVRELCADNAVDLSVEMLDKTAIIKIFSK